MGNGVSMNWAWPPSRWGGTTELAGQLRGDLGPVVLADHVQAKIDAGRAARRRQDVTVVDEEHRRVDRDVRVATGQIVTLRPMGGDPAPVEQTGFGQDERSGTQRDDATPSRLRSPKCLEHLGRHEVEILGRRHDNGACVANLLEPVRSMQLQAAIDGDRYWARPADGKPVPRGVEVGDVVLAENVAGDAELEQRDPLVHDNGHRVPRPYRPARPRRGRGGTAP